MLQDLRFALRLLGKHPAPASVAVGGLSLAIGVVSAVFSLVNATMLRPYGMNDPQSVVRIVPSDGEWSYSTFRRFREGSTLGAVEASTIRRLRFTATNAKDIPARRDVQFVSGGYLPLLGARPAFGRILGPDDDTPAAPAAIVVSDHFWNTEFVSDPGIVGRTVWLNGSPATIVGVMRPEFTGPVKTPPSIWATFAVVDDVLGGPAFDARTVNDVEVVGRLAPGATSWAMQEQLAGITRRGGAAAPAASLVRVHSAASPIDGPGDAEAAFVIGTTVVALGLLLALACANTANLLMASAMTRAREMGIRLALGATARRLVRQMLSESMLIVGIATALGLLFAIWFAPRLRALVQISPEIDVAPDASVLLFTVSTAVLCGVGCGLAPARHGARHVLSALQSSGGGRGGAMSSRWRSWFVGFQAAVSVLLLVVAAMLTRTVVARAHHEVGFDADRLVAVHLAAPSQGFDAPAYLHAAMSTVRVLPGVERASLTIAPWFGGSTEHRRVTVEDGSFRVFVNRIDAEYLATAGVRLLRGRPIEARDLNGDPPVALMSAAAARAIFGDADPIGRPIHHTSFVRDGEMPTVVGVVSDTVVDRLHSTESVGAIYRPIAQPWPTMPSLVVRAAEPGRVAQAIEAALQRLDSRVQSGARLMHDGLEANLTGGRMLASLAGAVAALAFLLAGLGIYGVMAFVVSRRTEEISIRLAIGASASAIVLMLLREGLRPVVVGLVAGLTGALVLAPLVARPLSIPPFDPVASAAASGMLILGALAAVIPAARRAARSDPASLLRA
jgi:putative ABC transport system permease protein